MFNWSTDAHDYQKRAAAHLYGSTAATLWLSPGYGKTAVTLHAFKALKDAGEVQHMLVVAPLRVVQTVWAQEIEGWATLHGLRAARLHGTKKEVWLKRRDVNVWLINYEGLPWLADMAKRGKVPFKFDVVVFDEVRRMKNSQGLRFKSVKPVAALAKYRWGLTGTPASNGLMDLFGQFLILDGGEALGQRITRFRHDYFEQHYDGFTWVPRPGAQEAIEKQIEPYVFRADGKLDLPDFVYDNRTVVLDAKARKIYTALKNDLITALEGTTITAANAAVLMGKLKQMANGRVYDENRKIHEVHTAKKDALVELVDELGDEQLLIAYEYNHDLDQIREALGADLPYLGAGVNEKTALDYVDRWNSREIKIMAAHPASAGHGLNLQKGGAHHILWWGPTFDLDHYIQFNDRLRRQGNTADAVVVHTFIAEKSVDETAIKAREEKDTLQTALLNALTAEFGESIRVTEESQENHMQLQFKSDAALAQPQPQANPFAQAPAQAPANPFAQTGQQTGQAPANLFAQDPAQAPANPFAQAPAPQANPFAQAGQQTGQAPANPFAQAGQQTGQAPANPFAQAPAPQANPFGQSVPQFQAIQQDVAAPPPPAPQPESNPFAVQPQVVEDAQVVDTGWQAPPVTSSPVIDVPSEAPTGFVPFYTMIPADKLDKVLSALARAVK